MSTNGTTTGRTSSTALNTSNRPKASKGAKGSKASKVAAAAATPAATGKTWSARQLKAAEKYDTDAMCNIVAHVAVHQNVSQLDQGGVQAALIKDLIVELGTPTGKATHGTRPAGRKLLAKRIDSDQAAVRALFNR